MPGQDEWYSNWYIKPFTRLWRQMIHKGTKMEVEKYFKNIIFYKTLLLVLIIFWGGSVEMSNESNPDTNLLTDVGGLFFAIFSLVYFVVSYQLYKFKLTGKRLYMPMVLLFILLGFITETVNPMQIDKNFFYLFIFYIISPLFFIAQGFIIGMIYFSKIQQNFK